jgi:hypothetical protein
MAAGNFAIFWPFFLFSGSFFPPLFGCFLVVVDINTF